jgi:hypothetical protein
MKGLGKNNDLKGLIITKKFKPEKREILYEY